MLAHKERILKIGNDEYNIKLFYTEKNQMLEPYISVDVSQDKKQKSNNMFKVTYYIKNKIGFQYQYPKSVMDTIDIMIYH